ncbi:uncharacterized protein NEMAJ01_0516 [Nematocida major]|uniref:uncharacterized protein n=1 Tax=Nematocida major TaxID=1912982 RepID=UPI002007B74A|nr:uncharacterized protein NEMAJ01_0516 [Nematocida major]KAH9385620.1 hypothetical protein NEMAJ01_0516 [Nematocida major]
MKIFVLILSLACISAALTTGQTKAASKQKTSVKASGKKAVKGKSHAKTSKPVKKTKSKGLAKKKAAQKKPKASKKSNLHLVKEAFYLDAMEDSIEENTMVPIKEEEEKSEDLKEEVADANESGDAKKEHEVSEEPETKEVEDLSNKEDKEDVFDGISCFQIMTMDSLEQMEDEDANGLVLKTCNVKNGVEIDLDLEELKSILGKHVMTKEESALMYKVTEEIEKNNVPLDSVLMKIVQTTLLQTVMENGEFATTKTFIGAYTYVVKEENPLLESNVITHIFRIIE